MICPKCGTEKLKGYLLCANCGNKVLQLCTSCGNVASFGAKFCDYCGQKTPGEKWMFAWEEWQCSCGRIYNWSQKFCKDDGGVRPKFLGWEDLWKEYM